MSTTPRSSAADAVQLPGRKPTELNLVTLHRMCLESMHFVGASLAIRGLKSIHVSFDDSAPSRLEVKSGGSDIIKSSGSETNRRLMQDTLLVPGKTDRVMMNSVSGKFRKGAVDDEEDDAFSSVSGDDDIEEDDDYETVDSMPLRRSELTGAFSNEHPIRTYVFRQKCGFNCDAFYHNPGFFPFHPMMSRSSAGELDFETLLGPAVTLSLRDIGVISSQLQKTVARSPFNALWRSVLMHCLIRSMRARQVHVELLGLRLDFLSFDPQNDRFLVSLHITLQHTC
jgi:hypothetical protein